MRSFRILTLLVVFVALAVPSSLDAQDSSSARAIRTVLDKQAGDWNRGDMAAFATGYKNSPDILFMGSPIAKGYAQMVERYRTGYSTPEKMGKLGFAGLEVQPLDANFATVTGTFHLERTAAGGGNSDGYFLLVMERTPAGWKIVRDATTVPPKKTSR